MGSMVMTDTKSPEAPEAQEAEVRLEPAEFRARCAELEARLRQRAGQIAALQARFLADLADYDELRGWAAWGTRSVADWLSNHCGHGSYLAHAELTLAHELEGLPRIRAAMESGARSMDKAKALAPVASEETEEELLGFAREATANQLARAMGAARRCLARNEADHLRRSRQLVTYWDDDGALRIRGRLAPEDGAVFRQALEAAREELYREIRSSGFEGDIPPEGDSDPRPGPLADAYDPYNAQRADALLTMVRSYLATGAVPTAEADNYKVVVHADAEVLADDGDGRCHLDEGAALCGDTVRRLACGASFMWVFEDQRGNPLAVSEQTQPSLPRRLRRAIRARDGGCVFPNGAGGRCGMPAQYCDVHHVIHRAHGGEHSLTNCWTLCSFHHHLVHEGGFAMAVLDDGMLEFRSPDGAIFPPAAPPFRPFDPDVLARELGELEPDGPWARSRGESMDLAMAVDFLLGVGIKGPSG